MSFQGETALHVAAGNCYLKAEGVQILLQNGYKPDEIDNKVKMKW